MEVFIMRWRNFHWNNALIPNYTTMYAHYDVNDKSVDLYRIERSTGSDAKGYDDRKLLKAVRV